MEERFIPLSVPNFIGRERQYADEAISAGWVSTGGAFVTRFEKDVAAFAGVPEAVACQNGTAALHIGLLLMGVTREDAVLVPALTFIAAVNPIAYIGAEPIFMDCDEYLCIDPVKLARFCAEECRMEGDRLIDKATGRHIKAMVVVHVFGNMADMEAILCIAQKYHIRIVEDATEALGTHYTGGAYSGKHAGTMGDIGAYSFNGNKIITTGGGGMIISMDQAMLKHARHLTTQAKADELNYIHDEIGFNYRMTNVQAALGVAQMEELPAFLKIKKRNYDLYRAGMRDISGLRLLPFHDGVDSNHWFYALYVEDDYPLMRDALIVHLRSCGIQARPIWGLICDQAPYAGARAYDVTNARTYHRHVVNIPCSTSLTEADVMRVLDCLQNR